MRRYQLRLRPVCRLSAVVIWWDAARRHYVCALTQPDGQTRHETYERLREAIYWQRVNAVFDDRVLRACSRTEPWRPRMLARESV